MMNRKDPLTVMQEAFSAYEEQIETLNNLIAAQNTLIETQQEAMKQLRLKLDSKQGFQVDIQQAH